MKAININGLVFQVRSEVAEVISDLQAGDFNNIQGMLVELFEQLGDQGVYSDEYALAIEVYFAGSKATDPDKRQGRCATDVRKYNGGVFKCQDGVKPDTTIRHLDGGVRSGGRNDGGLDALSSQL